VRVSGRVNKRESCLWSAKREGKGQESRKGLFEKKDEHARTRQQEGNSDQQEGLSDAT